MNHLCGDALQIFMGWSLTKMLGSRITSIGEMQGHSDIILRRNLRDWDVSLYMDLMDAIYQATLCFGDYDSRDWDWENSSMYLV